MKLSEIVRTYRKTNKMTQEEFAKRCNLTKGYISMIENEFVTPKTGKKFVPSINTFKKLSAGMGMDLNQLINTADSDIAVNSREDYSFIKAKTPPVTLPLYGSICCGNGGFVDDNIIDSISLPSSVLNPDKDYFAQYASGDSMRDAGIEDGDLLVFEKCSTPSNGMIGCFCIDDNEAMCKRYRVTANNVIKLVPANEEYDPIIIDIETEHFRCVGKLALVISDRRDG